MRTVIKFSGYQVIKLLLILGLSGSFALRLMASTAGFPGAIGTETTGNMTIGAVQKQKGSATAGGPVMFGTETTNYLGLGAVQRAIFAASSLTNGVITATNATVDSVTIAWTSGSGGTAPITEQLQITANPVGTWTNVGGATASPGYALNLAANTIYNFRVVYTDATPTSAYSPTNAVRTAAAATIAILSPGLFK